MNLQRNVRTVVVALASAIALGHCGPDTVNNYNYDRQSGNYNSGESGLYTCQDAEDVDIECVHKDKPGAISNIAQKCEKYEWFTQECIDCVVSAPCETGYVEEDQKIELIPPFAHCVYAGVCQKPN